MKIIIKSLQGDEYVVDIQNNQNVLDLKAQVSQKASDLPIGRQKLVSKGRTMRDKDTISEFNLHDGSKVHLIVQKENIETCKGDLSTCHQEVSIHIKPSSSATSCNPTNCNEKPVQQTPTEGRPDRFEEILRERLANHFAPEAVEKIMANLNSEINADMNSPSLDDLELLAKQKLNISNE